MLESSFKEFIREKEYLDNLSPRTLQYYRWVFARWTDLVGEEPNAANLKTFVIKVRESGVSTFTANSYIRGFNSYLSWLNTGLKIRKLKEPEPVLNLFTDRQVKSLISVKGKSFHDRRLHALVCLLVDTGIRIDEALGLRRVDVDFENLLVTVHGKGGKDRIVPISRECRRVLYLFKHSHDYMFPACGHRWSYRSALDSFKRLCTKLGIEGPRCSFHTLRHFYAVAFIRNGGDIYRLSRLLGHTDIKTTSAYLRHMGAEPIREAHAMYSPLSRL